MWRHDGQTPRFFIRQYRRLCPGPSSSLPLGPSLATKPNGDRWQLRTLMFVHFLFASLRDRCEHLRQWHVYSSSVNKLLEQILTQMRDISKGSNPWFSKWLEIHCGGDLPLKLSMNADLKFSANDKGERCQRQESTGREHRLPVIAWWRLY